MDFPWGHTRRFNSYPEHFRKLFGERVQKLTIDAGFTCPNRDGLVSTGGCHYCNNSGFNPSYCMPSKSITQQLKEGVEFHEVRYRRANKYLAYFQAFSNTYDSLENLKKKYEEALAFPNVIGLVIGTRPDCVDDEKLDYLQSLTKDYYVVIEYGVETCNDEVLKNINRGHDFNKSKWAIEETSKRGIKTGTHFIIGLPGESPEDFLSSMPVISSLPLNTIKFHQFQIITDTHYAEQYKINPSSFILFQLDEYLEWLVKIVERLNPDFVIERIASEVPPWFLVAPDWGLIRNQEIVRRFEKLLLEKDTWQGKCFK
jgi:uncharacterized protein